MGFSIVIAGVEKLPVSGNLTAVEKMSGKLTKSQGSVGMKNCVS